MTNPATAAVIGTPVATAGTAVSVTVSEDLVAGTKTAYVADSAEGLQIIDVSDLATAAVTDTIHPTRTTVTESHLFQGTTTEPDVICYFIATSEAGDL